MIQNQMTRYQALGSAGNFFAEAIIKKYKKTEEYAYQGVSLVFLEKVKEEEEAPLVKSEVLVIYHLLLQEIYYKYYNQMVINRKEILLGIEQSIEQHLHLVKRDEPQRFLEVYSFYQQIRRLDEEKNLQKIEKLEKLIQERIGITVEKADGVTEQIEAVQEDAKKLQKDKKTVQRDMQKEQKTIQKAIAVVQANPKAVDTPIVQEELQRAEEQKVLSLDGLTLSGAKEYFTKLIQKNSIEENRELYQYLQENNLWKNPALFTAEKATEEQLKSSLSAQIEKIPKYKMAQLVFEIKEKLPKVFILYKIQEKFFRQVERVKETTNLTGQEYEIQQQILLSLVQTATKEEQQTLYQYFDKNHLIYTDISQNNKNQLDNEAAETYETAELLQIVREIDIESVRMLSQKWKKEIETKIWIDKEVKEEAAIKEAAKKDTIHLIQENQKREEKQNQNRKMTEKKEEIAGSQSEQTRIESKAQNRVEQGLLYLQQKLEERFGKERYKKIKQDYLKNLLFSDSKIKEREEKKRGEIQKEDQQQWIGKENEVQEELNFRKIWQIVRDVGIDIKKEREKAILFSLILAESQFYFFDQKNQSFFQKYKLEETIRNMDRDQIKNLVKEWKTKRDRILNKKEEKKENKENIKEKENTKEKVLKIKQPLAEIQRIKNTFLNLAEEGKPETIDFIYDYLTDRKLVYRQQKEEKESQKNNDRQEKISIIEEPNQIPIKKEYKIKKSVETKKLDNAKVLEKTDKEKFYLTDKRNKENKGNQIKKNEIETDNLNIHTKHSFEKIKESQKIKEYLLTKVEAGEPKIIDSFYQYLTERKLIYRQQAEAEERKEADFFQREEKQREIRNCLKKLQKEYLKEEIFISYWNAYLKKINSKKQEEQSTQKERIPEKEIQKKEFSKRKVQEENPQKEKILSRKMQTEKMQTELEEIWPKRTQIEKSEEIAQKRIQIKKLESKKLESKERKSEKIQLEKVPEERKTVQAKIQQKENNFILKDIRIYKEPMPTSAVQEKKLYFSMMERYQKEVQRLGIDRIDSESSQQEKRIRIFLQILEESSLEESDSFYQYIEQNYLLYYKPKISKQDEAKYSKEEEQDRKQVLLEWIQSAAAPVFYKLQKKWIEEYEKQQIAQIEQESVGNLRKQKESKISSVITRYFKALQTLSLQENKSSVLEQQKQILEKTVLEGSKEEKQSLYHYLTENHFIYRKESKEKEEIFSFDKKRIFIKQLKQLDKEEFCRILEQIWSLYQEKKQSDSKKQYKLKALETKINSENGKSFIINKKTEKKQIGSFLLHDSTISNLVKLVYFRKNKKDLLIRDIRITGKDHTAEDSVTEYIKYSAEQAAFDWIKKERGEHKAALPYQEISLLFRKEQKGFEKPKEQEKERKEEIQYYITKTAEKQIHLESEYTKKEIQEQEKELLLVKTALKQQQEKIEEMERNQLKEINSEKIYQMVMKKMEAQLRLERLRRGLS